MNSTTVLLMALRGATVLVGVIFLTIAVQAYRKYADRGLLLLAGAIGLMVLAAAAELIAFWVFGAGLATAEIVEAAITLLAFLVLLVSVRKR